VIREGKSQIIRPESHKIATDAPNKILCAAAAAAAAPDDDEDDDDDER